MDFIYYSIVLMLLIFTLPLAAKQNAYAYPGSGKYNALERYSVSTQRILWIGVGLAIIMLMVVCIGKREDISDNLQYLNYYNMGGGDNMNRDLEPTFTYIVNISPSFTWLLGIYAALSVGFHMVAIFKNSPNIWLSLFIYLGYYFVLHDLIQIRAAVAIGILLYAIRFIPERKFLQYELCALAAVMFHFSAVIFVFLYFVPYKNLNKWIWAAIMIIALAMNVAGIQIGYLSKYIPLQIIQNYLEEYLGNKTFTQESGLGISRIGKVLVVIVMLFNLKRIKKHYPLAVPVLVFYMISLMFYLLMGDIPVMQGRMGELMGVFEIYALAMFPFISKKYYYILFTVPILFGIYEHATEGYVLLMIM